jgi:hypothetical protein
MEVPLLVHDDDPGASLMPGTMTIAPDFEHGRIICEVLPEDGAGIGISLCEGEAVQIVLMLVGAIGRLRGWSEAS